MRIVLGLAVALLAVIGVAASVRYFFIEPYNAGFLEHPVVLAAHVALGGVYLALAPFQLVPRIRRRYLSFHRRSGRVLVAVGLVTGLTAFFISVAIPFSGVAEQLIVGFFALFFTASLALGYLRVREGRIAEHREWMIRALSIGLGIATMRLLFVPALVYLGEPTLEQVKLLSIVAFTAAFLINGAAAEAWIRHTRRQEPSLGGAPVPSLGG